MAHDTVMGLGLAALGRPGYINLGHDEDLGRDKSIEAMRGHARSVLDAAWEGGVRYFDAARSYGRAEEFLADWLTARDHAPDTVTVASKWGYTYTADWKIEAEHHEIKDHSLPVLERQWKETQALLGPWLDRYQIHSATLDSGVLENAPVLDALARFRDQGTKIGLSVSGPDQATILRRALEITRDGRPLFESVQATWNLLERSAEPALEDAAARGLTVIVKEALANGRLTPRGLDTLPREMRDALQQLCTENDTTLDTLALATALNRPWAGVVLSGAARLDHLRSNLRAPDLAPEASRAALATPAEDPANYWNTRSNLAWN